MSTKSDILALLRREALTVTELSSRLNVTRNAVIIPLKNLEAEGLIEGETRRSNRAGKPAVQYTTISEREDIGSQAYPVFAEFLMEMLADRFSQEETAALMQQLGQKLAMRLDVDINKNPGERLAMAVDFLNEIGADISIEKSNAGFCVKSYTCPLSRAVRQQPCVCLAVAAFLEDTTGCVVEEKCDRGERLRCRFEVAGIHLTQ